MSLFRHMLRVWAVGAIIIALFSLCVGWNILHALGYFSAGYWVLGFCAILEEYCRRK